MFYKEKKKNILVILKDWIATETMRDSFPINDDKSIGRIRFYNEVNKKFSRWLNMNSLMCTNGVLEQKLNRGGCLRVYDNLEYFTEEKRIKLYNEVKNCPYYRQYGTGPKCVYKEPRLHILLASKEGLDYQYHQTKMKSIALSKMPEIEKLHDDLAEWYKLPGGYWDLGVDLIHYRNGNDSIGYHAADTQGETIILSLIVDSNNERRRIKIRPNRKYPLKDKDEEIEISLGQGNAYEMDGKKLFIRKQ